MGMEGGPCTAPEAEVRLETLLHPQSCLYPLGEHCAGGETEAGGCDIPLGAGARDPLDGERMGNYQLLRELWVGDAPAQPKFCPQSWCPHSGLAHRELLA